MRDRRTSGPGRDDRLFWWIVIAAAAGARIAAWAASGGFQHPDEHFQYLEPAYARLTGLAWLPWEFERGARSWILASGYGGLMWWARLLGLDGWSIQRLLCLHNALLSLALVPATARIAGALGSTTAARVAAVLTALWLPIVYYMPRTLSEVPAVLLTTWGMAFCLESRGRDSWRGEAMWAGLAFGFAIAIRPALSFYVLVPGLVWLLRREWRGLAGYALGGALAVAAAGLVDLVSWGRFAHVLLVQWSYQLVEGGVAGHGTSPWPFYLETWLWERAGVGGLILLGAALLRSRSTGLVLVAAALPVVLLSILPHKEERFAISSLPLLVAAGSAGLAGLLASRRHNIALGAMALIVAIVLGTGFAGMQSQRWRWREGIMAGQRLAGRQPDATGVLLGGRIHLNGGYLMLERNVPQLAFSRRLASHHLFNYLVLEEGSPEVSWAGARGFEVEARPRGAVVMVRRAPARVDEEERAPALAGAGQGT